MTLWGKEGFRGYQDEISETLIQGVMSYEK